MFLAIDRVSKFTYVEFRDDAGKMNGAEFMRGVVEAFPYVIHTVLTDNGMAFADLPKNRNGPTRHDLGAYIFDRVCHERGIKHRLINPCPPWTHGQAERMNRTVKEATIKAFRHPDLDSLKALQWKTPFEVVCQAWTTTLDIFELNLRHLIPGPSI